MDTIKRSSILGTVMCRCMAVAAILALAMPVLSDSALAQPKQPKLKEILEKSSEEEEAKEEAKGEVTEERKPEAPKPKASRPPVPDDEFNRGTPSTCIQGFMKATGEGNYERATNYLELSDLAWGLTFMEGPLLARQLRIVL